MRTSQYAGAGGAAETSPDLGATLLVLEPRMRAVALRFTRDREAVHRGLAQLPPEERRVVFDCHLGDLSYEQFARDRGHHPAAVKSRAFRARRRLAGILETSEL